MSFTQYRALAIKRGTYLAALLARLNKIPLAQVQLWNRRIQNGNHSHMEA